MSLEDLPPLREVLAAHGLTAKKSFGQHFLLDLNVTRKIVRLAEVAPDEVVIEVGPGPGGLSRALLEAGAFVIAIEKDARFLPLLQEISQASDGRMLVLGADALKVNELELFDAAYGARNSIVSNLPYNVGTPLLVKWLTSAFIPDAMTLMFQKEVALRIAAEPGSDDYGRLSVLTQAVCEARLVMEAPARAFTPPPKVDSAVVRLTPLPDRPDRLLLGKLERITAAAFGQRRKMLRSSLKPLGGQSLCEQAGVDAEARAEVIDVAGFLRLAEALSG